MADISFKNIEKIYPGGTKAVSDFCLDIADKEFMVIMGPSGCGKSTLLKLIAGLEKPTGGRIFIGGEDVTDLPPGKRGAAIVMQTNTLFPHLNVFDNLAFGLTVAKTDKETIRQKVLNAAEMLNITDLLDRRPSSLSGGQKQRVALGRALAVRPRVFLLDEPLSNLDASLKSVMRAEIRRLHKAAGTTFVYVTHDQLEAMSLGGRIAILKNGELQQAGTPQNIYDNPANRFIAGFIGTPEMNFFNAKITPAQTFGNFTVCFCGRKMQLSPDCLPFNPATELELTMGIRPDNIRLADEDCGVKEIIKANAAAANTAVSGKNIYGNPNGNITTEIDTDNYFLTTAKVSLIEPAGGENLIHAALDNTNTIVLKCSAGRSIILGDSLKIIIDKAKLRFFDKESGKSLQT